MTQIRNIAVVILNYNGSHFLKKYLDKKYGSKKD